MKDLSAYLRYSFSLLGEKAINRLFKYHLDSNTPIIAHFSSAISLRIPKEWSLCTVELEASSYKTGSLKVVENSDSDFNPSIFWSLISSNIILSLILWHIPKLSSEIFLKFLFFIIFSNPWWSIRIPDMLMEFNLNVF